MKKTKFMGFFAILFGFVAALAFTPAKVQDKNSKFDNYYELADQGVKTERTDWVISSFDGDCESTHSANPCRIMADADGPNPSEVDFLEILDESEDFEVAYPAKVSYYQP